MRTWCPSRSIMGSPDFRAKSFHACLGSQTTQSLLASRKYRCSQCCLPTYTTVSALWNSCFSGLNTQPACATVNASRTSLLTSAHDSWSLWFARPSTWSFFLSCSWPALIGAFCIYNYFNRIPWSFLLAKIVAYTTIYFKEEKSTRWKSRKIRNLQSPDIQLSFSIFHCPSSRTIEILPVVPFFLTACTPLSASTLALDSGLDSEEASAPREAAPNIGSL